MNANDREQFGYLFKDNLEATRAHASDFSASSLIFQSQEGKLSITARPSESYKKGEKSTIKLKVNLSVDAPVDSPIDFLGAILSSNVKLRLSNCVKLSSVGLIETPALIADSDNGTGSVAEKTPFSSGKTNTNNFERFLGYTIPECLPRTGNYLKSFIQELYEDEGYSNERDLIAEPIYRFLYLLFMKIKERYLEVYLKSTRWLYEVAQRLSVTFTIKSKDKTVGVTAGFAENLFDTDSYFSYYTDYYCTDEDGYRNYSTSCALIDSSFPVNPLIYSCWPEESPVPLLKLGSADSYGGFLAASRTAFERDLLISKRTLSNDFDRAYKVMAVWDKASSSEDKSEDNSSNPAGSSSTESFGSYQEFFLKE